MKSDNKSKIIFSYKHIAKKNIVEIDDGASLKKVRDISCVWYNYIDQNRNTNVRVAGFIAQQVKEHLPEAVALESGFIPNEMRILNVNWSETIMKPHFPKTPLYRLTNLIISL